MKTNPLSLAWIATLVLLRPLAADEPIPENATRVSPFVNSLGMRFVPVPGTKVLFSIWDTRVMDFRAYTEATNYRQNGGMEVMQEGPVGNGLVLPTWFLDRKASWENPGFAQAEDHPVVGVNWNEAKAFCAWLSKKEGRLYRLPTSAEWTAAVGPTKYPWGNGLPPPKGAGNLGDKTYFETFKQHGGEPSDLRDYDDGYAWTSPVGTFSSNWLGLFDMGGNVIQWCEDWHDPMNARGFPFRKECRVQRGSAWTFIGGQILWSVPGNQGQLFQEPTSRTDQLGFRCVLEVSGD